MLAMALAMALGMVVGAAGAQAQTPVLDKPAVTQAPAGPTPYPAADAKDWPGKGAIRVFGWMNDNRKAFWAERARKQGSVVFAGDSLIGGWRSLGQDLPQLPVANRGIGGETTRGLLFRFNEDVMDLHPKAVVLLSGTNDLSTLQDPRQTLSNLVDMIELAEKAAPGVPIVVCTVPPRNNPQSPVDPKRVAELNTLIQTLATRPRPVAVFDLYGELVNPDGSQRSEFFAADKLHLSPAGYERFREGLKPILKQLNVG